MVQAVRDYSPDACDAQEAGSHEEDPVASARWLVVHRQIGEDQAVDGRPAAAQDQRRLAFAGLPAQQGLARFGGAEMDHAFALYRAFAPVAGGDDHGAFAVADRVDRFLQRSVSAARFEHGKTARAAALGKQGSKRNGPHRGNADCGQEPAWQTRSGRDEGRHHRPDIGFDG